MPTLPVMVLAQPELDAEEAYSFLWDPATTPDSGEILQGGLDSLNYGGGNNSIPAHAFQRGTFARGWYQGFDRWEFQYARQLDGDGATPGAIALSEGERIVHAGLSGRFFLPWTASVLVFGYQAFFRHDATEWGNDDGAHNFEYWELQAKIKNQVEQCLYVKLPHNRYSTGNPDPGVPPYVDPGHAEEQQWKWVHKQRILKNVAAGYQQFEVSAWARIMAPDAQKAKLLTPTGGIWMLAIR